MIHNSDLARSIFGLFVGKVQTNSLNLRELSLLFHNRDIHPPSLPITDQRLNLLGTVI
jgi:hypothetical protein